MPPPTVFFDEAGNTGAALTDTAQPVFVLASTNLTNEEAEKLLALVRTAQAREGNSPTEAVIADEGVLAQDVT